MIKKIITSVFVSCLLVSNIANSQSVFSDIGKAIKWGGAGVAVLSVAGNKIFEQYINQISADPSFINELRVKSPSTPDSLILYIDEKIQNAQVGQDISRYVKVKELLGSNSIIIDGVVINDLPLWKSLEEEITEDIKVVDRALAQSNRMPKTCSIAVVAQLLEPASTFQNGIGSILPYTQTNPTSILDVNSFANLKDNYDLRAVPHKLTPDHIPSYSALEKFFISHKFSIPLKRNNSPLELNSTAIAIPTQIHMDGSRTFGGRNNKKDDNGDKLSKQDAKDLLKATIKDITIMAYMFIKNPQYNVSANNYIDSALRVYERNKTLCMYDVKYGIFGK